jgi:protein-tyrosine phosphatase
MSALASGGILVVCAANVCRSPLIELVLRSRFESHPVLGAVPIGSAGVHVDAVRTICERVGAFREDARWRELAVSHRARQIEPAALRRAALVIAATRGLRSMLVTASPETRSRVFTLREAVWLGEGYVPDGNRPVERFRDHIHGMRGLRPSPPARRRAWRLGDAEPLDIADRHGARASLHRGTVRDAARAAEELADLIAGAPAALR